MLTFSEAFDEISALVHGADCEFVTFMLNVSAWRRVSGADLTFELWFDNAQLADLLGIESDSMGLMIKGDSLDAIVAILRAKLAPSATTSLESIDVHKLTEPSETGA